MAEERILSILREAGASEEELERVRRMVELWRRGVLTGEDLFNYIIGLAWARLIPLTPRQVGEIARALGVDLGEVLY